MARTLSSINYIKTGVPQGSNLVPLLFLIYIYIYINDLPNCLNYCTPALFADDTNITVTGVSEQDIERKLNTELNNLHHWLLVNKLSLNISKMEYMIIGSRERLSRIEIGTNALIDAQSINRVTSTKTLGVFMDEKITCIQKNFKRNSNPSKS